METDAVRGRLHLFIIYLLLVIYLFLVFFSFSFFLFFFLSFFLSFFLFFETGFLCVALEPVLELAIVDQAGLELREIHLPLPPECWD